MMRGTSVIAFAALVLGCGNDPATVGSPTAVEVAVGPIVYEARQISAETAACENGGPRCARVTIDTLEPVRGGSDAARDLVSGFIREEVSNGLRGLLPAELDPAPDSIDELAAAFLAQQQAFIVDFPDGPAEWFVSIDVTSPYNTAAVTTLSIVESSYTGGAHPNTRTRLASFDLVDGRLLAADELTHDPAALVGLIEARLRIVLDVGPDGDLASAGLWLGDGGLALPENMGVVTEGLAVHWNPYEIAPYSMGPIDVVIPVADLDGIVDASWW
jgi:hypothetical protein